MFNLDYLAADRVLNWATGNATTPPTLPLKVRLLTALGDQYTPGVQVAGGSYAPQSIVIGLSALGVAQNTVQVAFGNMPACTVIGAEVWDNAGLRWWWGPLSAPRTFAGGETALYPVGAFTVRQR